MSTPQIANKRSRGNGKSLWRPPIVRRKYPSGKVAWQVATMIDGERIRRTFKNRPEAEAFADQIGLRRYNSQVAGVSLPLDSSAPRQPVAWSSSPPTELH